MKTKQLFLILLLFTSIISFGQSEQCGTMIYLEEQIKKDPSIKERMLQIEKENQEWIEKNGRGFKKHFDLELNKNSNSNSKSLLNTNDLCGYNNIYSTTITAPSTVNSIVSPSSNCILGGQYVRVINLIAGRTYRISTIGLNNFDTQITIYPAGGGSAVAFNDDWAGSYQSEIYFTPFLSGNYDILIDEYGCLANTNCANLEVELWYVPRPVITIPVVVHVMHEGTAIGVGKNISDAQIQSQIDVLNEDFRRLNQNILTTPAAFRGASADPLIQFCLAQQTPEGTPTTGIERFGDPSFSSFTTDQMTNVIMPLTIWDRNKYLNLWSIDFGGENSQWIGFSSFPGDPANRDGVLIKYNTFGNIGNISLSYNLGRNATHEIGHWLNLKHIWGDEDACAADDFVLDTPKQSKNSNALYESIPFNTCPIFPVYDSCTPAPNYPGIMFMNYMDYGIDQCKSIYTYGQFARIDATLFNQRSSLFTSPGCLPGSYKVVISQVYGGGGNTGAPFTNDFIELYNRGTVAQNLNGWSVQFTSATGPITSWFKITLPDFTLQPGQYYLIQGPTGTNGVALPTADLTNTTLTLNASAGKIILVSNNTAETTANPSGSQIIDKIGYGPTATGYEGSGPTAALSNTTASIRNLGGCKDTDNNVSDFTIGTPIPRNSASQFNLCGSLSVSQNTLEDIKLYPNPTNSKVFFDNSNTNYKEVVIYNYLGQEVAREQLAGAVANQEINLSNLSAGVYVLKFHNGTSTATAKVVKQ